MATIGSVNGKAVIGSTLLVPNVAYKDTPVTVTSWSYVTTTITLNVASHTFVASDYIEVSGLTATTNIPNGIHLVTSVTATTIVFTYALTPTGTAGVSSATVKGYVTTNGRTNGIGEGQTWQDMTASRFKATNYTNGANPMFIHVHGGSASTNGNIQLLIDGVVKVWSNPAYTPNGGVAVYGIIPPYSTYRINEFNGVFTTNIWMELR